MRKSFVFIFFVFNFSFLIGYGQTPETYTSSEILLQLKKLNVLGSVLYIAAHPDDENTRLLAYLANEKMYRTGYLSLTRGDGGQNLIGDEQGIDLGLIRTQELLAARRIDGAEQFFSRAYDFGFCKSSDEAIKTWGHDKILSDIVWVIRKFKPDVIITRFPEDSRAGHGHHSASAILASEAFDAAADPTKFPEQLKQGVTVWQAKRLLWNTFNFGSSNTQSEDQFKLDVGMFNPLLGKSYGEIAALSRSQHKSQGFGVPAQRGTAIEYFKTTKGSVPVKDLMEGVDVSWDRTQVYTKIKRPIDGNEIERMADSIIKTYPEEHPEECVPALVKLYNMVGGINNTYWKEQKLNQIKNLIEMCSGLFMEATTNTQYAVQGDTLKIVKTVNNRSGVNESVINWSSLNVSKELKQNVNLIDTVALYIKIDEKLSQPYWLDSTMEKGSFNVKDPQLIGKAENDPMNVDFSVKIEGQDFVFKKPVRYKYTDPVKGEIYQPVNIIPSFSVKPIPNLTINNTRVNWEIKSFIDKNVFRNYIKTSNDSILGYNNDSILSKNQIIAINDMNIAAKYYVSIYDSTGSPMISIDTSYLFQKDGNPYRELRQINYDHIPSIAYTQVGMLKSGDFDLRTVGKLVGYIVGAGDKVPQALERMGYKVTTLKENDLTANNLKQFAAIITGVRAYNTNDWLNNKNDALMQYVKEGGVLLTQYNTNNNLSTVKSFGPYPFTVTRNRVTDETAKVNFLLPNHPALNYPNKITEKDFDGWIQERSIYNAENIDSNYQRILSMKDPGENDQDGSLIIADYGKGKFIYTGLVFFRELPAGVPGAYRLLANLLANKNLVKPKTVKKHK